MISDSCSEPKKQLSRCDTPRNLPGMRLGAAVGGIPGADFVGETDRGSIDFGSSDISRPVGEGRCKVGAPAPRDPSPELIEPILPTDRH